jgi:uncharacterized protein YraI
MNHDRIRPARALRLAGAAAVGAVTAMLVFAGPASAATGTVHTTSGASLTVRSGPHTTATAVGSVADGATVTISCQTHGDTVTGMYGTSDIWDKISTGYVTDTYVYTGSNGTVAPACDASTACSTSGLGDPNTCAQAVSWATSHETTTYHADYYNLCDHVVGLAYGFPASGSTTAYAHWQAIPAADKHAGDKNVPAGGLAFFSGGAGHVMISIGGGAFVSTDIHGNGTLTQTTIAEITNTWGKPYLGWAEPWFQYNH